MGKKTKWSETTEFDGVGEPTTPDDKVIILPPETVESFLDAEFREQEAKRRHTNHRILLIGLMIGLAVFLSVGMTTAAMTWGAALSTLILVEKNRPP